MKEMSDNEFDRLFKEKSDNFDYQFEEEAWDLMEKKLRKRDRIVYIQRLSIAALFLLFLGTGLYLFTSDSQVPNQIVSKKAGWKDSVTIADNTPGDKSQHPEISANQSVGQPSKVNQQSTRSTENRLPDNQDLGKTGVKSPAQTVGASYVQRSMSERNKPYHSKGLHQSGTITSPIANDRKLVQTHNVATSDVHERRMADSLTYLAALAINSPEPGSTPGHINTASPSVNDIKRAPVVSITVNTTKPKFSFTLAAGPDYSSIQSLKGKQGNVNVGLLLNVSYKKFMISTGARYGIKKYSAGAFDYALNNPANAKYISEINASCNVLEIPAQLSYTALKFNKQRLDISTGLSSYLMLKEKYQFCYKPETGRPDYYLQKDNENRSYFGVLSLAASYKFKPTKQHILIGIEPYAKLPLGGVGEGKVRLKSSGVALTMTYEIKKRN